MLVFATFYFLSAGKYLLHITNALVVPKLIKSVKEFYLANELYFMIVLTIIKKRE
jgi:hypothetical protein